MKHISFVRKSKVQWVSGLALALLAILCLPQTAYVQAQTCRDVNQLTLCGDQVFDMTTNGGGFALRGDVRINLRSSCKLVFSAFKDQARHVEYHVKPLKETKKFP